MESLWISGRARSAALFLIAGPCVIESMQLQIDVQLVN
jgi:3-deoxy-D-manno-octulosonic acid (KDO) 8-phosphate synthase